MSQSLHVAKIHPVDNYTHTGIYGWDSQTAFYDFLKAFDVSITAEHEYQDEFEVYREDLRTIAGELALHGEKYREAEEDITSALETMEMTEEEMITALMRLITESDQSNEWVLVSWF